MSRAAVIDGEVYVISDNDVPNEASAFLRRNGSDGLTCVCSPRYPDRKMSDPHIENFYLTKTKIGFGVGKARYPPYKELTCEICRDCTKTASGHVRQETCYTIELRCDTNHTVAHDWYRSTFNGRVVINGE